MANRKNISNKAKIVLGTVLAVATVAAVLSIAGCRTKKQEDLGTRYISPSCVAALNNGVVVGDAELNCVYKLSDDDNVIATVELDGAVNGICTDNSGNVYATYGGADGKLAVLNSDFKVIATVELGHTPMDPVLSPDGSKLYVANRYSGNISVVSTSSKSVIETIGDMREPFATAMSGDGTLYVASLLPNQAMTDSSIACAMYAISAGGDVVEIALLNGTTSIRDICISPDGKYVVAAHVLARYGYPTTQIDRGWINTAAITLVSTESKTRYNTVLLDGVDEGAANPYGISFTANGEYIAVSLAGTDQLELVNYSGLLQKLSRKKSSDTPSEDDLTYLDGIRFRIKMPGKGPRSITMSGEYLFICQYFTGNVIKIKQDFSQTSTLSLGTQPEENSIRMGERYWNDAGLCYQGWQSCASCHPDVRVDAVSWDNLNDGIGNAKQTKSLLYAYRTPPQMITGIRATAEIATRAGVKFIQFAAVSDEVVEALDSYIKSIMPEQSPYRNKDGSLTESATRGKALFESNEVGCASCHGGPLYTDLHMYDVGTVNPETDGEAQVVSVLDTPTLVEVWRTAPYLYNGKALTLYDVIKTYNTEDKHGKTSHLTEDELRDLENYILSIGAEGEDFAATRVISVDKDGNETQMALVPGTTIESIEIRRQLSGTKKANVTFELFKADGTSIKKKTFSTPELSLHYTENVKLNISVPSDLEKGAYYTVVIADDDGKTCTTLKITY